MAHYADGSDGDDARALIVQRACEADAAYGDADSDQGDDPPASTRPLWRDASCPVGVEHLVDFARTAQCVAAARGASKRLLQALEAAAPESAATVHHCAIAHAAASDAVGALVALVGDDPTLVELAVLESVHFCAAGCLETLVNTFGPRAVAAAANALHDESPTHELSDLKIGCVRGLAWPLLCSLPAMPQVVPTLLLLKRCGAPKLSAKCVAQLTVACRRLLDPEATKPFSRIRLARAIAAASPAPWEQRLGDYDVLGALAAALDILGWEGDLAAVAERVRGAANERMCELLEVFYVRGVRPTASHVESACTDGDSARVLHVLAAAAPDGVDFSGASKDAADCLLTLVEKGWFRSSTAEAVAALIAAGAAPASPSACSALCWAVHMDSPGVAEVLLDAGTPIDVPSELFGVCGLPLHHAAGLPDSCEMLLRRGAAVDARAPSGLTALAVACECVMRRNDMLDGPGSIALLLDHGASLDDVDGHGACAEDFFLRSEGLTEVYYLAAQVLHTMHRVRGAGVSSALVTASRAQCEAAVRAVAGTLDTAQLAEVGATALLSACNTPGRQMPWVVTALLDVVPPSAVHATDDRGNTPLHLLLDEAEADWDHGGTVRELLSHGAAVDAENADGLTALELHFTDCNRRGRCRNGAALSCVEALLDHGARCRSSVALHFMVSRCGSAWEDAHDRDYDARVAAVVTQLIARGVPVDERGKDGETAEQKASHQRLDLTHKVLVNAMRERSKRAAAVAQPVPPAEQPHSHSNTAALGSLGCPSLALPINAGRHAATPRAGPTISSSARCSDDDEEDGRATAMPAPRRHRREVGP